MKRGVAVVVSVLTVVTFAFAQVALVPVAADAQAARPGGGLTVPVTATQTSGTGSLANAGSGTFTIKQFVRSTDPANQTGIDALGTFVFNTGTGLQAVPARVPVNTITTAPVSANGPIAQQIGECPILHLELGPIHLDLLGLEVDVSEIVIDIVAQAGAGNLLGNLLCAIAGLLDPGGPLTNLVNQLIALLNQLLGILG